MQWAGTAKSLPDKPPLFWSATGAHILQHRQALAQLWEAGFKGHASTGVRTLSTTGRTETPASSSRPSAPLSGAFPAAPCAAAVLFSGLSAPHPEDTKIRRPFNFLQMSKDRGIVHAALGMEREQSWHDARQHPNHDIGCRQGCPLLGQDQGDCLGAACIMSCSR